jgi:hypothetical protein
VIFPDFSGFFEGYRQNFKGQKSKHQLSKIGSYRLFINNLIYDIFTLRGNRTYLGSHIN